MNLETKGIDQNRTISEYEKRYGGLDMIQYTTVFELTKWSLLGFFIYVFGGLILTPFLAKAVEIDTNTMMGYYKDGAGLFGAAVMALVGYFVGRGARKE